jgi:hypothetical protein
MGETRALLLSGSIKISRVEHGQLRSSDGSTGDVLQGLFATPFGIE